MKIDLVRLITVDKSEDEKVQLAPHRQRQCKASMRKRRKKKCEDYLSSASRKHVSMLESGGELNCRDRKEYYLRTQQFAEADEIHNDSECMHDAYETRVQRGSRKYGL